MPVLPTRDDLGGTPSVRPSGGLASADTTAIGRGVANLGNVLADTSATLKAGWQANEAADVEARYQEFQFAETKRLDEASRGLDPSMAQGFADREYGGKDSAYGQRAAAFFETVPDRLKGEYNSKLFTIEQNAFFKAQETERGLQKASALRRLDTSLNGTFLPELDRLATLPSQEAAVAIDKKMAEFAAMIDAVPDRDLPPAAKAEKKYLARQAMELAAANALPPDQKLLLDPSAARETYVQKVIQAESGGDPTAANPRSSARGAGQFTRDTWLELVRKTRPDLAAGKTNEQILALRDDPALSSEMVDAYSRENASYLRRQGLDVTPGNLYLAHFLGPAGAAAMLAVDPSTSAKDVNPSAAASNPTVFYDKGLNERTAGDLIQWAAEKMGADTPLVDWGARLQTLSPEQRQNIATDGANQIVTNRNAQAAAEKAAYDQAMVDFRTAIESGDAGMADWQAMLDAGVFRGADATTYRNLIQTRNKDQIDLATSGAWLANVLATGEQVDTFDADNRKRVDTLYEQGSPGGQALLSNDDREAGAAASLLGELVSDTGIMPTQAVSALRTGIRSTDPGTLLRSYQVLNQIYESNQSAVEHFLGDDIKRLYDYRAAHGIIPEDQLGQQLAGEDKETREARQVRADAARRDVQDVTAQDIANMYGDRAWWALGSRAFTDLVLPGNQTPLPPADPIDQIKMEMDYREAYTRIASWGLNPDKAQEEALRQIGQKWTASSVGSERRLMRYAPEANYPAVNGSHDYMNQQLETYMRGRLPDLFPELVNPSQIMSPARYWLVSTSETEAAVSLNQRGQSFMPPRYGIQYVDSDGVLNVLTDENTARPVSVSFSPPQRDVEAERAAFEVARSRQGDDQFTFDPDAADRLFAN